MMTVLQPSLKQRADPPGGSSERILPARPFPGRQVKILAAELYGTTSAGLRVGGKEGGDVGGRWRECKGESGRL